MRPSAWRQPRTQELAKTHVCGVFSERYCGGFYERPGDLSPDCRCAADCPPRSCESVECTHERIGRVVLELGVVAKEGQLHRVGRAVTLLADDDLGQAFIGRFLVVVLVAVDE